MWWGLFAAGLAFLSYAAWTVLQVRSAANDLQVHVASAQQHATSFDTAALAAELPGIQSAAEELQSSLGAPLWSAAAQTPGIATTVTSARQLAAAAVASSDNTSQIQSALTTLGTDLVRSDGGLNTAALTGLVEPLTALGDNVDTAKGLVAQADPNALGPVGTAVLEAQAVATTLGIDAFHAGVKPDDKLAIVAELQRDGHLVAMAGDGINDAPALAQADIGIAMGTGSDIAIDSAAITLVQGDLRGITAARGVSQATVSNMKQNLGFAFLYNTLGIPIAAGVLYPFTGLMLSPIIAAAAMSLSSVSVILNALRLRRTKV